MVDSSRHSVYTTAALYRRLSIRRCTISADVWFVNRCIHENLTPTFAKVRTSNNVPERLHNDLSKKLLRSAIIKHNMQLDRINTTLKTLYDNLQYSLDQYNFHVLMSSIFIEIESVYAVKHERLTRKLDNLRTRTGVDSDPVSSSHHKFHPRVINLSNVNFSPDELGFLDKGLKYSIFKPDINSVRKLSIEIDVILQNHNFVRNRDLIRSFCNATLCQYNSLISKQELNSRDYRVLRSLREKVRVNNLVISKADKGNCVVVLSRADYVKKVEEFISNNNFETLPNDNTLKFNKLLKAEIKNCESTITKYTSRTLTLSNPMTPRLYGLPKLHKTNIPIRPVVSFINTPASKLAVFLKQLIVSLTEFKPQHAVINSQDLVSKIKDIRLNEKTLLVSFDVSNLFTSVPIKDTLVILENLLRSNNIPQQEILHILTLTKVTLQQNFFQFNNSFYSQPDGLAMGSSLSPLLAEIFMNHLECNNITNNNNLKCISHWFRYVDDCLVFIEGDSATAQHVLDYINTVHSNIKFTMEIEKNSSINFLDLTITKVQEHLEFSIYRKPTQTDHTIPHDSNHPFRYKIAAFNTYIHRLKSIPLSDSQFSTELNLIKQLAISNGYPPTLIANLLHKYNLKRQRNLAFGSSSVEATAANSYFSLTYIGNISQKIANFIEKNSDNVSISFKPSNSTATSLINSKDRLSHLQKSGIYKLSCGDCPATYIGQTRRNIDTRIKEHINKPSHSVFGHHLQYTNHSFDKELNSKLLHDCKYSGLAMDMLEDLEIKLAIKDNNLNCINQQNNLFLPFKPLYSSLT